MLHFERQQFDFFLQTAVERYVERLEQRFRGSERAIVGLREDVNGHGAWLREFCDAVFDEFLLNNVDGACFILRAVAQQKLETDTVLFGSDSASPCTANQNVESHLRQLAKRQFSQLLYNKTLEALEQHSGYQPI